ncbi:hypothetical protein HELRODRAFT_162948 [Helobdella robusta]|uniref:Endonuclease/exonuclease/phosphatase domain-containing protein n=1 Tax=Helobdella robusta TaxID=6412 RepID=T1ETE6_HELRO|nr:hypothetical protein HELRODRAFT_162948 [Helobdella robusta]ESN99401.1 hypothetical protein HELRODRAFT_162948 [Helobdella robusta]
MPQFTLRNGSNQFQKLNAGVDCDYPAKIFFLPIPKLAAPQFEEKVADCTFFCQGRQTGEMRTVGVGFAIRSSLIKTVNQALFGISPRLMRMQLSLEEGHAATLISCYAPTLKATKEEKDLFYEQLSEAVASTPYKHQLVLGRNGVGKENSNGTMLLELCTEHSLVITNMVFQQANKKKTSWKHPHSSHRHLIDYILTNQRDLCLARLTKAFRKTTMWSDHCLIKIPVFLTAKPAKKHQRAARITALVDKRKRRKQVAQDGGSTGVGACGICDRRCLSRIGLFAYMKSHQ